MKNCLLSGCLPFLLTWHNDARACYSFAVKWYLNYAVLCLCAWPIAATTYWWDIKMPVQISDTVPELERSYDLIRYRDSQLIFSGACTPQTQREGHEETRQEIAKWQKKLYRRKRPSRARSFLSFATQNVYKLPPISQLFCPSSTPVTQFASGVLFRNDNFSLKSDVS